MQKRQLGNSNLEVSAIGLGCMRMSHDEDPIPDKQEMIAFIHQTVDRGITFHGLNSRSERIKESLP